MAEFQAMQRYIAKCAGGEWDEPGSWSYHRNFVDAGHLAGLEAFMSMESADDVLTPEELQDVSQSLTWIVSHRDDVSTLEETIATLSLRLRIREFARDCKEDARQ